MYLIFSLNFYSTSNTVPQIIYMLHKLWIFFLLQLEVIKYLPFDRDCTTSAQIQQKIKCI